MQDEDPRVFVPQQFTNPDNVRAQSKYTAYEIINQVDGKIHGFCSGIGTGGTISGIGGVLKNRYPDIEIWAAEPEDAAILAGSVSSFRRPDQHMAMHVGPQPDSPIVLLPYF